MPLTTNVIDVNLVDDAYLYNIDYKAEFITLAPEAIIYRGYSDRFADVDTLEWYYPWRNKESQYPGIVRKRPLFYGSYQHTKVYSGKPGTDTPGDGPIYRFWAKKPLKLWSFNYTNIQKAIAFLLKRNAITTITKMIYAFGFLYNNVENSLQLLKYVKKSHPEYKTDPNLVFLDDLQTRLITSAGACDDQCRAGYGIQNSFDTEDDEEYLTYMKQVKEYCYDQCWYETSRLNRIDRKSLYAVDKPLMECLFEYLSRRGYDGIFAWNLPENSYIPWKHHDIIIFDSPETLVSDNLDINNNCEEQTIQACPKRIPPAPIAMKRLKNGVKLGRGTQEQQFKKYNDEETECLDKPDRTFSLITGRTPVEKPVIKQFDEPSFDYGSEPESESDEPYRK